MRPETNLAGYLEAARGRAWVWGEHDCSAWPARWAGIAVPRYSTEREAVELVDLAGGLIPLWEAVAGERLAPTDCPVAGDVGVIEVRDGEVVKQLGSIYTGRRWAFVPFSGGFAAVSRPAVRAWRVVCPSSW